MTRAAVRSLFWGAAWLWALGSAHPVLAGEEVTGEARALTGVSLVVRGAKVHLSAVSAPGAHETCHADGRTQSCAEAAKQALGMLLQGQAVRCAIERKVGHGSFQGTCRFVEGGDLGEAMVRGGWAHVQISAAPHYRAAEAEARAAKRGLWAGDALR